MKTYQKTHPWISFQFNLKDAPWELWLDLGEAASKCEHLSLIPLRPATKEKLHQIYMAKGIQATTAIEGNTLSEEEVLKAVEGRLSVPPSKEYLKQEVDNVIAACNQLMKQMVEGSLPKLSSELLAQYNQQILEQLPLGEDVVPGKLRTHSVLVGNVYRGAPAEDCPYLLDQLCKWLNGPDFQVPEKSRPGMEIVFALIQAIVAHLYIAWIHPFGDGNGRTARLAELHILLSAGIPTLAAHLLSNHYNQTRTEYYRQLDYASKSRGDILPFLRYAIGGFVDGLRQQLAEILDQSWDIAWEDHVHHLFSEKTSKSEIRQCHLAIDLGLKKGEVLVSKIPDLTPRLTRAYANKNLKTLQRDLKVLEEMQLIKREENKVKALQNILFFLSPSATTGKIFGNKDTEK